MFGEELSDDDLKVLMLTLAVDSMLMTLCIPQSKSYISSTHPNGNFYNKAARPMRPAPTTPEMPVGRAFAALDVAAASESVAVSAPSDVADVAVAVALVAASEMLAAMELEASLRDSNEDWAASSVEAAELRSARLVSNAPLADAALSEMLLAMSWTPEVTSEATLVASGRSVGTTSTRVVVRS